MREAFALQKLLTFFQQKTTDQCQILTLMLTYKVVSLSNWAQIEKLFTNLSSGSCTFPRFPRSQGQPWKHLKRAQNSIAYIMSLHNTKLYIYLSGAFLSHKFREYSWWAFLFVLLLCDILTQTSLSYLRNGKLPTVISTTVNWYFQNFYSSFSMKTCIFSSPVIQTKQILVLSETLF